MLGGFCPISFGQWCWDPYESKDGALRPDGADLHCVAGRKILR